MQAVVNLSAIDEATVNFTRGQKLRAKNNAMQLRLLLHDLNYHLAVFALKNSYLVYTMLVDL